MSGWKTHPLSGQADLKWERRDGVSFPRLTNQFNYFCFSLRLLISYLPYTLGEKSKMPYYYENLLSGQEKKVTYFHTGLCGTRMTQNCYIATRTASLVFRCGTRSLECSTHTLLVTLAPHAPCWFPAWLTLRIRVLEEWPPPNADGVPHVTLYPSSPGRFLT